MCKYKFAKNRLDTYLEQVEISPLNRFAISKRQSLFFLHDTNFY